MIKRALATELGGEAKLKFLPTGLICEVDAPLPSSRRTELNHVRT
jgi:hypothetical protein